MMTDTTRIDALKSLEAKVIAGGWSYANDWDGWDVINMPDWVLCRASYLGSLDAAKSLHEAVLPGWDWLVTDDTVDVWTGNLMSGGLLREGKSSNPARAWLLAVIRALIVE